MGWKNSCNLSRSVCDACIVHKYPILSCSSVRQERSGWWSRSPVNLTEEDALMHMTAWTFSGSLSAHLPAWWAFPFDLTVKGATARDQIVLCSSDCGNSGLIWWQKKGRILGLHCKCSHSYSWLDPVEASSWWTTNQHRMGPLETHSPQCSDTVLLPYFETLVPKKKEPGKFPSLLWSSGRRQ